MFKRFLVIMAVSVLAACAAPVAVPTDTAVPTTAPTANVESTTSPTPVPVTKTSIPTVTQVQPTRTSVASRAVPTKTSLPPANTILPPTVTSSGPTDYVPDSASVWNFVQGPDQMSGSCSGSVLPPYGLVQITPVDNGLTWRSQEPIPYTFAKVQTNVYNYSGATATGDGSVTMTLTFLSGTDLVMTRTFVSNTEPDCSHTHDYTGTFQWSSD